MPHLSALPPGWRNASKRSDSVVIRFCKLHDSQDSFLNRKVTQAQLGTEILRTRNSKSFGDAN